ncbi:MAG: trehalose-phosphatase [Terriglobales bacterium]
MSDPAAAAAPAGALELLAALAARRDLRVAIVSGRTLADLRARCPVTGACYVGGHGNETSDDLGPAARAPALTVRRRLATIAEELGRRLPEWPGARLEAKPYSLALHYRGAPQSEEAIRAAFSAYAGAGDVRVMLGRQVLELLPAHALTKGHAVERLRHRLGCDLALYFGDDVTDEDVFRLADAEIIGIKVEHTENSLPTAACYRVGSPQEVLVALQAILALRQAASTAPAPEKLHKNYAAQT